MSNAELIERLRKAIYSATAEDAHKAADALELADKRIAEEREQHDIMMERGAEKLAEAERKLAVAREALNVYACMSEAMSKPARKALTQIGGEDAR